MTSRYTQTQGEVIEGRAARWYGWMQKLRGGNRIAKRMVELVESDCGGAILDIGCGNGEALFALRERCGSTVQLYGIDPSEDMIHIAKRENEKRGAAIDFSVGIGEEIRFENESFDWVISSLAFHHLPLETKKQSAQEIRRVLKLSGRVLISDWGVPSSFFGRLLAVTIKRHAFSKENLEGKISEVLHDAGFSNITVLDNQFGVIAHIQATK